MNTALLLLGYAVALVWLGPLPLRRITRTSAHPKLAVASWLTAVATALAAWFAALGVLGTAVLDSAWHHGQLTLCLKTLGLTGELGLPRTIASAVAIGLLLAGLVATAVAGWRVVHRWRRQRSLSRLHAANARVVGGPSDWPGVVVVPAPQPAAYCVADRPESVIVVTSAALNRLDERQLAAVLAHEYAHLASRHHDLLMALRAMAASLPRLPLFAAAADVVADLLELCADDVAVRRHGKTALLHGLLALTGGPSVMASATLGAANTATLARAERLAIPVSRGRSWLERVMLSTTIGLAMTMPLVFGLACQL
ncbi:heat shock protein HtpX [Mycobacterium basiliense]|uniref:Heat shock protein HtpX n=1 Tax=Mycobacterium basiliense TaxID=2094119 RepID=A0A3S4BHL7_9MYCO|nr:M56 family metallopeptidase [Mycobacterium basiliense]VDM90839.1 heat shock protein HtpX [Mycobacterium basiliense]